MSQTIENRIVEMQFENKQFESGVQESLSTLDKLKKALKFDDASKNLEDFSKNINKNIDLSGVAKSVEDLNSKFSSSGIAGMEVMRRLTDFAIEAGKTIARALDAPFRQIREGGWKRAMNIEDAKFQLKGLGITWESVSKDIDYAVADTAFGLDAAAKACAQLSASGIQAGEGMKAALRGISGVAAMGNTEYENIADIFTRAAGNGKVMAMELNRISQYGLNARASLSQFYNAILSGDKSVENIPEDIKKNVKAVTKGVKTTEADISEFARKSKIDFRTFSYAMDSAFGEHAKKANETFMGSLRNIKAALSKIGAEFATPIIKGAIPIFNEVRVFLNDLRKQMGPVFEAFSRIADIVSGSLANKLKAFRTAFLGENGFGKPMQNLMNAFNNIKVAIIRIVAAISTAFKTVFPETRDLSKSLETVTGGIAKFTEKLISSDETLILFKNVLVIILSILKDVGNVIKSILPIIGKVVTEVLKIVSVIIKLASYLSMLIFKMDIVQNAMDNIRKAGGLFAYTIDKIKDAFAYLKDVLSDTSTVTGRVFAKLKDAATLVAFIVGGSLYLAFLKLKELFSYFDTHDPLGSVLEGVNKLRNLPIIKEVVGGLEKAFNIVADTIEKVIKMFVDFVNDIRNGKSVIEALGTAASTVFGGMLTIIGKVSDAIKSFFGVFQKENVIEESFEMPIENAGFALGGIQHELTKTEKGVKSTSTAFDTAKGSVSGFASKVLEKITSIKASHVILGAYASLLLIIAYNANELISALGGLTRKLSGGLFNLFKTSPTRWEKTAIGIKLITTAVIALAGAIYVLSKIPSDKLNEVTTAMLKLIGTIGAFSFASAILSEFLARWGKSGGGFGAFSTNMFALTAGLLALAGALKVLDSVKMSGGELWEKVAVIGAMALGMATLVTIMSKVAPKLTTGSIFILAFSASMLIMSKALDNISRINFTGIKDNFAELTVIILAFAAFAALAGTVGISSTLSLVAFLVGLNVLFKNADSIKANLEKYQIGEMIVTFFSKLKTSIKTALEYVLQVYDGMSSISKVCLAIVSTIGIIAFTYLAVYMRKVADSIKKAVVSIGLIAAEIALLTLAVSKIVTQCKGLSWGDIGKCLTIMGAVGALILGIIAITGLFAGDTTSDQTTGFGLFGRKRKSSKNEVKNVSPVLKQIRKMLVDMGIMLAAMALFINVVGKLDANEFARARDLLKETMIFIGVIMTVITLITAFSRNTKGAAASAVTFVGVIALLGTILGGFVILMNYLKDYNFDKNGIGRIATALVVLTIGVVAVFAFLKALNKNVNKKWGWANILALTPLFAVLGQLIISMTKNIKPNEVGTAVKLAAILVGFMGTLMLLIWTFEAMSNKTANSKNKRKAFLTSLLGLAEMIAAIGVIGLTLSDMVSTSNNWKDFASIGGVLIVALAALVGIVLAIEHFAKSTKFSITKTSQKNLIWTLSMIAGFIVAFVLVARVFYQLRSVDAGRMWGQATALITTLGALIGLAMAIITFVDKVKPGWKSIGKAGAIFGGMVALFAALSAVFMIIDNFKSSGGALIGKSQTIVLVMLELEVLAAAAGALGMFTQYIKPGELCLLGMVALFAALSAVFLIIDNLKTEGIMAKSQTIILVMLELEVLGAICMVLGGLAPEIGLGELCLLGMVGLFWALTEVFTIIDGLKTEGIMKKSQTIILVMLELEVLAAIAGVLGGFSPIIALGELCLLGMVGLFWALAEIFTIIDRLKVEGIMKKSQTMILVMLELEVLAGIAGVLGGFSPIIALGELCLLGMVGLFAALAMIFTIVDKLNPKGLLGKSQTMVLVLLELEALLAVLGALSPLATAALAGVPGILAIAAALIEIAYAINMIGNMDLAQMQGTVDVLIGALNSLLGIGVGGIAAGPGLMLLAAGITALGGACMIVAGAIEAFAMAVITLSGAIASLVATGPGILQWFTSIANGVQVLAASIMMTITGLATSVVVAINILITGIITALLNGGKMIFAAAVTLGKYIYNGLKEGIKEISKIAVDIVKALTDGVRSIASKIAEVGKSIGSKLVNGFRDAVGWHSPVRFLIDFMSEAGSTAMSNGEGVGKIFGNIGTDWGNMLTNGFGSIDLSSIGLSKVMDLVNGLKSGEGSLMSEIMRLMGMMDSLTAYKNKISSSWAKDTGTMSDYEYGLRTQISKNNHEIDKQNAILKRANPNIKGGAEAIKNAKDQISKLNSSNKDLTNTLNGLLGKEVETTEATNNLSDAFGGMGESGKKAKGSTTEVKDEIADFYDKMEGAISLFEEFNKETDLTSDKLISNMRSQIEGMTEWANQIQKLAFMGIDQGLLQQLADMGPQGYQYTNAFVHMTAEQLQEANNLYHQSLMLPGKVTSQIYGSYTVAGRSAASGFLQGMNKEDIKGAAVGFAHEVIDQMNEALDIVSGYSQQSLESGKAVTTGVKDGIQDPTVNSRLSTAIGILTDAKIQGKFYDGLFKSNQMYTVGANITRGIADGIEDGEATGKAKKSVENLCGMIIQRAEQMFDEHSPSKVFQRIGGFLTEGLGIGITSKAQSAVSAMSTTSEDIINTMRETINMANQALMDDINEPVITPILDLSQIEQGSRDLNNLISRNSALNARTSFTNLQNTQWGSQSALLNATMDDTDVVDAISSLSNDINTLKDAMTNIKMVLDTGTMVGAMTPQIDQQLGMRQVLAGRGI